MILPKGQGFYFFTFCYFLLFVSFLLLLFIFEIEGRYGGFFFLWLLLKGEDGVRFLFTFYYFFINCKFFVIFVFTLEGGGSMGFVFLFFDFFLLFEKKLLFFLNS